MSYGPVNRKTLADVNLANRGVQDSQGRDPDGKFGSGGGSKVPFGHKSKDPGNKNDPMKNVPFGHRSKDPNQDSDLQEPQDPGESNDSAEKAEQMFGKHKFVAHTSSTTATPGPCKVCGENYSSVVHNGKSNDAYMSLTENKLS